MKRIRQSMLLSLGLILTACLLAGAAAGVHPEKKCYDAGGEEIPCNSNYYQTQFAARATARQSGPTAPAVAASPTPSPTGTPTSTATPTQTPTQTPIPTLTQTQEAAPPATSAPQEASPQPSATTVLILVLMVGGAGALGVILLFMLFRWLSGRRNTPPRPPS